MRIAAIYDIHGNLSALEPVLQEIRQAKVDCVVVGGDVLHGPLPRETIQCLLDLDIRAQFIAVIESLTVQLKAIGATWDDVVFRRMYTLDVPAFMKHCVQDKTFPLPWTRPSPSTLIGVTALSNPDFLVELEILVIIAE